MAWQTQLQPASFRNTPFKVEQHDASGGRRVASHEYPMRDKPFTQDLGRKQRKYTVQAFVLGSDYMAQRDALMQALELPGAGLLVHPYLGRLQVNVDSYSVSESTARGGMATFTLHCVEAGSQPAPVSSINTQAQVQGACRKLNDANVRAFERTFTTKNQLQVVVKKAEESLKDVAQQLGEKERELIALVNLPKALAQRLINSVATIVVGLKTTAQALERAFKKPVLWPIAPTATRQVLQRNDYAIDTLVNVATLSALAQKSAQTDYASSDDALAFSRQFNAVVDAQVLSQSPDKQPLDDVLYLALLDVQAAVADDIKARTLRLPQVHTLLLPSPMPSLVVCYQQYGDLRQEQMIIQRNKIARPGFISPTKPVEVLL